MHGGKDNYTYLTQAPIRRVIPTMAVPTITSMLVTSLYNIADTFFVGQLDTLSTAAVGVVFSLMFFIQAFGFFFGHGSGNYISRELGARRHGNARRMAANGFFFSLFTGLAVMAVGLILLRPLALLLGSTATILPLTEQYLSVSLLGVPFLMSSLTLNNQLRLQGNAAYAMVGIVAGAVINVVLDPIFIFLLDLRTLGAAIASVIGQAVSFALLLRMSYHEGNISIRWRHFHPSWQAVREIFYGGSPSMSRQGLLCFSTMLLNHAAGTWGDAAIAGMSIVGRITMLVMAVVIGLGQGFQPLCGFCYGARLYDRVKEGYMYCVKLGTAFLSAVAIVGYVFAGSIVEEFRHDADVVAVGTPALRWQLLTFPLIATVICSNMLLQTIRKPIRANLLAASRSGLFFIPLVITLPQWLGLFGLEICQAVADVCAFAVTLPVTWSAFRDMRA